MSTTNKHYLAGFYAVCRDVQRIGYVAARDKFNMENPHDSSFSSMDAYQYSKGGLEALAKALSNRKMKWEKKYGPSR